MDINSNQSEQKELIEAWNRYVNDSYNCEDIARLLDSVKDDEHLREFYKVLDRVWQETAINTPPLSKEQVELYKREFAQMISKARNNMKPVSSSKIIRFRKIWYAAAAAVLLGLLIPIARLLFKPATEQTVAVVQYIEAYTERGEIKTVILPDQTKVTLNVGSILIYPTEFTDERSVELQGGAIFEVTHDSDKPFTVATTGMNVKVLGTVFDVKAYPNDETALVTVASGKVEVAMGHAPLSSHDPLSSQLEKNEQLKIDKTTGTFEKLVVDADNYMLWTDGTLYFYRTPIREVVNMFNRRFPQTELKLADGEYTNLISGKLDSKRMETVLRFIIYTTGLKYTISGNKIILYNDKNENNK